MKKIGNAAFILILIFLLLSTSCQHEEIELVDQELQNALPIELSDLIMGMVAYDGSYDDIVDGAHCFSIDFPYTIIYDDRLYVIESQEDFDNLEDVDYFIFPITITGNDYKKEIIEDRETLAKKVESCKVYKYYSQCLDFVYPFSLRVFDISRNSFKSIELHHDAQTFGFMTNLEQTAILSINYPIKISLKNGENAEAGHNEALHNLIVSNSNRCDQNN